MELSSPGLQSRLPGGACRTSRRKILHRQSRCVVYREPFDLAQGKQDKCVQPYMFFSVLTGSITWGVPRILQDEWTSICLLKRLNTEVRSLQRHTNQWVYTEEYEKEHEARMREQQLHGWSRAKKEALIRGDIETLKQLSKKKDLS